MNRDPEKLMKELQEYLIAHGADSFDDERASALVDRFLSEHMAASYEKNEPETADDYLDLAEQATSNKKRQEYLRKALELEPDNIEAQLLQIESDSKARMDERLPALEKLMDTAAERLTKEGIFEEAAGEFWLVFETRPYMRICYAYFQTLILCGMLRRAIDEGQRLLTLCKNDNLGIRYSLMSLYAFMEDELHARALHKQFDSHEEAHMLLPLAVLYYKLGQFGKAEEYLRRLAAINKDTKKFFQTAARGGLDDLVDELSPFGYQLSTFEELTDAVMNSTYLYESVPWFFEWAASCLRKKTAGRKPNEKTVRKKDE